MTVTETPTPPSEPSDGHWVYKEDTGDWTFSYDSGPEGEWVENPDTGDNEWVPENNAEPVVITSPTQDEWIAGDAPVIGTARPNHTVYLAVTGTGIPGGPYDQQTDDTGAFNFGGDGVLDDGDWTFTVTDQNTTAAVDVHVGTPPEPPEPPPEEDT
jgi:hypothetical protein